LYILGGYFLQNPDAISPWEMVVQTGSACDAIVGKADRHNL